MRRIWWFPCLWLLGACNFFAPETSVQLLDTENQAFSTQIADVRATATTLSDFLLATQQVGQTAVRAVDQQSTRIASTLVARGMLVIDSSGIVPIAPTPLSIDAVMAGVNGGDSAAFNPQLVTPMVTGDGAARGSIAVGPTPALVASPTPIPGFAPLNPTTPPNLPAVDNRAGNGAPALTNVAFSSSVGVDDCPISPTTTFSGSASSIYVSAVGQMLTSSNVVSSRWLLDGVEQVIYTWSPSALVDGACIWFYITPEGVPFTPGSWSVELTIDGATVSTSGFTIEGDAMSDGS
ncbi:MAG: hypothetical protein SGI73_22110 [Chloroflexota bacterium]|nr:hypothetical protein [Chloroflexota bacterium]